jgi:xanthine dehydrogenase accessory factor
MSIDQTILKAYDASCKGKGYAFATVIAATLKGTPQKAGAKMVVLADGTSYGTIGGGRNEKAAVTECLKALKTGQPATVTYDYFGGKDKSVCGGQIKVFIEPFPGRRHFIICGAGHIALPLSVITKMLNFRVTIIDNRKELANKKRLPHVDQIMLGDHAEKLAKLEINEQTYVMIVTQGNEFDFRCLEKIIESPAAYIGVIASKAKRIKFLKRLQEAGITSRFLNRVKMPAGLDLGAMAPEEIAVSIASEVIKINNQTRLQSAKFQEKLKRRTEP